MAVPVVSFDSVGASPRRPFFSAIDSVDSSSGLIRAGRESTSGLNRGYVIGSELSSTLERYILTLQSKNNGNRWPYKLVYAWSRVRNERGGWDGDASGSPWIVERAVSPRQRQHQLQLEVAHEFVRRIDVSFWVRVASGNRYTPLIGGDVNGDGSRTNDRFGRADLSDIPGSPTAEALGRGLPRLARRCLQALAARPRSGSCEGPLTSTSALMAKMDFGNRDQYPRAQFAIAVENPLSVFGGAWRDAAALPLVDPYVANVQGFDAVARRFVLAPNPNFGKQLALGQLTSGAPRISLTVQIPLSAPIRGQQIDRWFTRRGLGSGLSADSLAELFARGVPNILDDVVFREDELGFSASQRAEVAGLRDKLRRELRLTWLRFAGDMRRDAASLSRSALMEQMQQATDAAWEVSRLVANQLVPLLSPLQQTMLPGQTVRLMHATKPVRIKVIYY